MKLIKILFTGLSISFLGTLPLGTLNIAAMQISVSDGIRPAMYFVLGALLVEVIYVRVSLVAMNWVMRHKKLFRWLEWISVIIVLALAVSSFIAAADPAVKKNVLLSGNIHRFWLGVIMSALNPVQIPFWFGWSTVLFTKNVLEHKNRSLQRLHYWNRFRYIHRQPCFHFGGRLVVEVLNANQKVLHLVIGCIFLVTAIILFIRMQRPKSDATNQVI